MASCIASKNPFSAGVMLRLSPGQQAIELTGQLMVDLLMTVCAGGIEHPCHGKPICHALGGFGLDTPAGAFAGIGITGPGLEVDTLTRVAFGLDVGDVV